MSCEYVTPCIRKIKSIFNSDSFFIEKDDVIYLLSLKIRVIVRRADRDSVRLDGWVTSEGSVE